MKAASSAEQAPLELGSAGRLALLALNAVPLLHAAGLVLLLAAGRRSAFLCALFLLPPLATRALFAAFGRPEGRYSTGSREFFVWWASLQFQMIFNRLPFLEELLRLVPGLYSNWLRLWGSRIGRFTYWSPGTLILDRSYLAVGDDVLLGAAVRLNGHVLAKNDAGRAELIVAAITLGDRSSLGGYSLLTAGSELAPDETTRAMLLSPPYSVWKDGRRIKEL